MSDKVMSDKMVKALELDISLDRRQFLRGGAAVAGAGAVASIPFLPAEAGADCVPTSGAIGGSRQQTLEALGNVMLPRTGTGAINYGVLDAVVYGKGLYQELIDPYYAAQITQSDLDASVSDLSNGSLCMEFMQSCFWKMTCSDQLALVEYGTKRSDEGAAAVSWNQSLCLWFGSLFGITMSNPAKAFDFERFCALLFYSSAAGFALMANFGYPGPNWGFDDSNNCPPAGGWVALSQPTFGDLTAPLFPGS